MPAKLERVNLVRGRLRAKFMERDRVTRELAAVDAEISALVGDLTTDEGFLVRMSVDQARELVFREVGRTHQKEDAE